MRFAELFVVLLAACPVAVRAQSDELSLHTQRAQAAIEQNDSETAIKELKAILRLEPGNVNALGSLGMVEFTRGDYAGAARRFEAALSRSPSLWSARAFLGMCEVRLGHPEKGRDLLEAAFPHITDKNLRVQSGLALVKAFSALGATEKVVPVLETLRGTDPENPEVLYSLYRVHSDIAAHALEKLTAKDKDSVWVHEILAQNDMAQEQYGSAIQEYRKALERDPRAPGLHFQLGQALFLQARTEQNRAAAEKESHAELEIDPADADVWYKLGQIAMERSDTAKAREYLAHALSLEPGLAGAHTDLAKILADTGDTAGAIAHLEAAERLEPGAKTVHYRLARLYRSQGRAADADREMHTFRTLSASESVRSLDTESDRK